MRSSKPLLRRRRREERSEKRMRRLARMGERMRDLQYNARKWHVGTGRRQTTDPRAEAEKTQREDWAPDGVARQQREARAARFAGLLVFSAVISALRSTFAGTLFSGA